ncbi:helix-turn-helix transcriptional regulator [uncultured Clostridium sp.]|uniref:helix-turn-helix domain-containing protein n=1 Tax=uncultured Clostridium sp. TaxID=59620 RepID=UPI0028E7F2E3|nr:helix-turn-helix transcriptional regulator [uncultured Clostridium sp.]
MNITGRILKSLRIKKNITLDQLAAELNEKFTINITGSMLSKWETGKAAPVYDHLKRLASYYEVTTDYLLGFDQYENLNPINSADTFNTNKKRIRNSKHSSIQEVVQLLETDEITTKDILFVKDFVNLIISRKFNPKNN